jgi:hypothetical protein
MFFKPFLGLVGTQTQTVLGPGWESDSNRSWALLGFRLRLLYYACYCLNTSLTLALSSGSSLNACIKACTHACRWDSESEHSMLTPGVGELNMGQGFRVEYLALLGFRALCSMRGSECVCSSYIYYVVAFIACTRSTFGNGCILSSFFSFILTSNKIVFSEHSRLTRLRCGRAKHGSFILSYVLSPFDQILNKKVPNSTILGPKVKKKDAVRGRNGCKQPLQTQNVGEDFSAFINCSMRL